MTTLPGRVKLSPDVYFQELPGEAILLDLRGEQYFRLNLTGMRLWQLLDEGQTPEAAVQTMLAEFAVAEPELRADVAALIADLETAGLATVER